MSNTDGTAAFIRQLRSNEDNFDKLYARLESEIASSHNSEDYVTTLQEIKEKAAEEYKSAKQTGGTAWPEFEKFVAGFEKAVLEHNR